MRENKRNYNSVIYLFNCKTIHLFFLGKKVPNWNPLITEIIIGKGDLFNTDAKALLHRTLKSKIDTKPDSLQLHEKSNYLQV